MVDVACNSLVECLEALESRFPELAAQLRGSEGTLRPSVQLYLNGESLRYRPSMDAPLRDGDELVIMMPIAGGSTACRRPLTAES